MLVSNLDPKSELAPLKKELTKIKKRVRKFKKRVSKTLITMDLETIINIGMGGFNPHSNQLGILADTVRKSGENTKVFKRAIVTPDVFTIPELQDSVHAFAISLQENGSSMNMQHLQKLIPFISN